MFADLTVRELLDRFASSDPTPGGGSAAALAGALGASLLAMVAGMPKSKGGTSEERAALDGARDALLQIRSRLLDLVDRDTQAYDRVVSAFRLPKNTDDEKAARKDAIQKAMIAAAETPLETMRVAREALESAKPAFEFGNPNAVSDAGVGAVLLTTAMQGGAFNVAVNLESITDEATRKSLAESAIAALNETHRELGGTSREGWPSLFLSLMKHAGRPMPAHSHEEQSVRLAMHGLREMNSPESRQALEVLAASARDEVAALAKEALAKGPRGAGGATPSA